MFKKIVMAALTALVMGSAHAVPVVNGGFEDGLTGWTCVADGGACSTGTQGEPAIEGVSYFWGFDNARPAGVLEQILATATGGLYEISFVFNTNGPVPPNALSISVGDLGASLALVPGSWTTYTGTFTALSDSTALDFLFATEGGTGTVWIDNVVVSAVPEPSVLALLGLGLAGFAASRRRKLIS